MTPRQLERGFRMISAGGSILSDLKGMRIFTFQLSLASTVRGSIMSFGVWVFGAFSLRGNSFQGFRFWVF